MSLKAGKEALLRKRYTEAIAILLEYCQDHPNRNARDYIQAQMWLVTAYQRSGRADKAIAICEQLQTKPDPQLQSWATKSLVVLRSQLAAAPAAKVGRNDVERNEDVTSVVPSQPSRYRKANVTLALAFRSQLAFVLVMFATIVLLVGLIFGSWLWLISLITLTITKGWLIVAAVGTAIVSVLLFFMSPWIVEIAQKQYQRTQWITLTDLDEKSPETVTVIEHFCQSRNIDIPKLGWIEDDTPVAFTYGILPNSARIVVSRGLFLYLDDDEIATVYAHQLGHIANWSFSVITYASAPIQLVYLLYVSLSRIGFRSKRAKNAWKLVAAIARGLHHLSNYLLFGVTRTSTYLCDCFAAEATGNPNGLARALTKIARGLITQNQLGQEPNRLLESTRALGICDYKTAVPTGMAFQILYAGQAEQNIYRVFLWELFNPWGKWLELHSTHPLIAKRIEALAGYAKQLGLTVEYGFVQLLQEGQSLHKGRLYRNFARDLCIETAPYTGAIAGLVLSVLLYWVYNNWLPLSLGLTGFGVGAMLKGSLRYPDYRKVLSTDLVNLLTDPYASSLQGQPVQIPGEVVGYGNDGTQLGYNLKLEDRAGLIYLNYLPNLKKHFYEPNTTIKQLESLIGASVVATGWFRRGDMPVVDLASLTPIVADAKAGAMPIGSYHQGWNNISSSVAVLTGLAILAATSLL